MKKTKAEPQISIEEFGKMFPDLLERLNTRTEKYLAYYERIYKDNEEEKQKAINIFKNKTIPETIKSLTYNKELFKNTPFLLQTIIDSTLFLPPTPEEEQAQQIASLAFKAEYEEKLKDPDRYFITPRNKKRFIKDWVDNCPGMNTTNPRSMKMYKRIGPILFTVFLDRRPSFPNEYWPEFSLSHLMNADGCVGINHSLREIRLGSVTVQEHQEKKYLEIIKKLRDNHWILSNQHLSLQQICDYERNNYFKDLCCYVVEFPSLLYAWAGDSITAQKYFELGLQSGVTSRGGQVYFILNDDFNILNLEKYDTPTIVYDKKNSTITNLLIKQNNKTVVLKQKDLEVKPDFDKINSSWINDIVKDLKPLVIDNRFLWWESGKIMNWIISHCNHEYKNQADVDAWAKEFLPRIQNPEQLRQTVKDNVKKYKLEKAPYYNIVDAKYQE
jgi:hypothetical protein